jgi:hypothetical protein
MDDEKLWITFWAAVGTVVCTLIICVTIYNMSENDAAVEMVLAGHDPVAVACAIDGDLGNQPTCVLLAAQSGE